MTPEQARAKARPLDWADPFLIADQLTDDERMIRETARQFAADKLAPRIQQAYREESFDRDVVREMGETGLLGSTLPAEFGGSDTSYTAYGLIAHEIERVDAGYRSMMSVQSSLVMHPIFAYGTDEQRAQYLPKLASGEWIGAFGLTEPDHGSDPGSMVTKAKKVDGGYQLSGAKNWISNAPVADVMVVWAKSDADDNKIKGFIIDRTNGELPGLATPKIEGKLSLRASITGMIQMDEVFVPDTAILPHISGLAGPFGCLNRARFGIAFGTMGSAITCWHAARDYTMERKQFGRPLAQTQLIQKKLADMQTDIALGLQGALRMGRLMDDHQCPVELVSMMKRNNSGKALEMARTARDMLGGNGISDEYPVMRHMMNLETVNTYEGTHDVHALILGRAQTGLQAFF